MSETAFYRIDPQQEVVLISNKWHRLVDVQRALTGQGVLVPLKRCEHGKVDPHRTAPPGYRYGNEPEWCPGAGIGGDDETV